MPQSAKIKTPQRHAFRSLPPVAQKATKLNPQAGYRRPQHIDRHASRLTTRQPWVAYILYLVSVFFSLKHPCLQATTTWGKESRPCPCKSMQVPASEKGAPTREDQHTMVQRHTCRSLPPAVNKAIPAHAQACRPRHKVRCLNPRRSKHHSDTPSGPYHLWHKRPFLPMQKHASPGIRERCTNPRGSTHHKLFYGHRDSAANPESQTLHAQMPP